LVIESDDGQVRARDPEGFTSPKVEPLFGESGAMMNEFTSGVLVEVLFDAIYMCVRQKTYWAVPRRMTDAVFEAVSTPVDDAAHRNLFVVECETMAEKPPHPGLWIYLEGAGR
jgi:hypothetical protein